MMSNSKLTKNREHIKHRQTKNWFPEIKGRKRRLRWTRIEKVMTTHK